MTNISPGLAKAVYARPEAAPERVDKNRLGHNFNRQAAGYDQHAAVQQRLAQRLIHSLPALPRPPARILEIGCGTGYLTALLSRAFPAAHLTALDLAPAAVQAARKRLAAAPGIDFLVADGEQEVPGCFDLITSNAVFQWFSQPAAACGRYYRHLRPGGVLAFATLGPATFRELAASFQEAGRLHPELAVPEIPAQHFVSTEAWQTYLERAGFRQVRRRQEIWEEVYPDLWAFLRAVRGMGATSTRPRFIARRLLAAMAAAYERRFRGPQGLTVTYEVMWLQGRKP
jgi:malonyl-CoA O-methyltransferase